MIKSPYNKWLSRDGDYVFCDSHVTAAGLAFFYRVPNGLPVRYIHMLDLCSSYSVNSTKH